jgi:hypothetical protein
MSGGLNGSYAVIFSRRVLGNIRTLGAKARTHGLSTLFTDSLRKMYEGLRADPQSWGDPVYRLPALSLIVCHGARGMLHARYAVDETRHLVYVLEVSAFSVYDLE